MSEDHLKATIENSPGNYLDSSKVLIAKLIKMLVENGVIPLQVSAKDFFGVVGPEEHRLFDSTCDWLKSEGIVREIGPRMEDTDDWQIVHVELVLTSFGFRCLDQTLVPGLTLGNAINSEVADRSKIGDLIGGILGGLTKSIMSS